MRFSCLLFFLASFPPCFFASSPWLVLIHYMHPTTTTTTMATTTTTQVRVRTAVASLFNRSVPDLGFRFGEFFPPPLGLWVQRAPGSGSRSSGSSRMQQDAAKVVDPVAVVYFSGECVRDSTSSAVQCSAVPLGGRFSGVCTVGSVDSGRPFGQDVSVINVAMLLKAEARRTHPSACVTIHCTSEVKRDGYLGIINWPSARAFFSCLSNTACRSVRRAVRACIFRLQSTCTLVQHLGGSVHT